MMKNLILILLFLLVCTFGFSQDITSEKKYNFTELFEQIQNEAPVFVVAFSKASKELNFLSDRFLIVFPLVEEKEMMNFNEGTRQGSFTPNISFGNFDQSKPSFTIHSSYRQQAQGSQHKILKGYDYCLRPIY